jgi:hypothetical protein
LFDTPAKEHTAIMADNGSAGDVSGRWRARTHSRGRFQVS